MVKKRVKRVPVALPVIINRRFKAEGLDLSESGIYLYAKTTLIAGNIVELSFELDGEKLNVHAEVQHSQPGVGVGLKFIGLSKETAKKIGKFIRGAK